MCGIAGFVSLRHSPPVREAALGRMLAAQLHRGPDDSGVVSSGPATLGMRRLAIFDPANGRQPMVSPDGRHHLVFNGAIYNFRELRPGYAARGWVFRTDCDTELLLAALSLDGPAVLPRLRGMFAFALWDARERALLLARDALGIKPLLYHHDAAGPFLFASEVRPLLASRHVPADLDPAAAADFLRWLAIPAPRTLHAGIRALRPGEQLVFRDTRAEISSWWTPAAVFSVGRPLAGAHAASAPATSIPELRAQLRAKLDDTIRAHLAADVPVGAFLSGGLDSAAVCALMARHTGPALKTFTLGFEEAGFSEAAEAAATARHLGVEHHVHTLTGAAVASDLDKILAGLDQPTGDGLNTYYASKIARLGGVTVALSGLGADELFGGYPSFRRLPGLAKWLPAWRALPSLLRSAALRGLDAGPTSARKLAATLRLAAAHPRPAALALAQRSVFSDTVVARLLAPASPVPDFKSQISGSAGHPAEPELAAAWAARLASHPAGSPPPWAALAGLAETRGYMADVLLRDSDEFSMAHSLELRTPFVDLPLAEWTWAQDPALLFAPGLPPKAHLAAACADLLPPALLERGKRGFTLPFATWLRGPLRPFMEETLGSVSAARSGLFDPYVPGRLWRAFRDGSDDRAWSRVWSLALLVHLVNRR